MAVNKEYQAAWVREDRKNNPEKYRARARARYALNRDQILARAKDYGERNSEEIKARKRARYASWEYENRRSKSLSRLYGITHDDYLEMFAAQHGQCAICHSPQEVLDVDHCHASGRVRGLLCQKCNKAIGLFSDDPKMLDSAIRYLAGSEA